MIEAFQMSASPCLHGMFDRVGGGRLSQHQDKGHHQLPQQVRVGCPRCLRSQPSRSIVDATTATSLSSSAKNLVRMTRWSLPLWDLRPS
jgi:hypothetical protein